MKISAAAAVFLLLNILLAVVAVSSSAVERNTNGVVIEKVVQEGSRMRLRCPLSRSFLSNTTVHWYRNNVLIITRPAGSDDVKPLYYYEEIFPDLRDNRLYWPDVIHEDAALYSCEMLSHSHDSPVRWRNFSVTVERGQVVGQFSRPPSESQVTNTTAMAPSFPVQIPYTMSAVIGYDATLQCYAVGVPTPEVKWYREGDSEPLTTSDLDDDGVNDIDVSGHLLQFPSVRQYDEGRYTCVVSNKYGTINHTIELIPQTALHTKPLIVSRPVNVSVRVAASAKLHCRAKSTLHSHTKWLFTKGGPLTAALIAGSPYLLPELKGDRYKFSDGRSVLNITNVTMEDAGYYSCVAFNSYGFDYASAYLSVVEEKLVDPAASRTRVFLTTFLTAAVFLLLLVGAVLAGWWRVRSERREKIHALRRAENMRVITKRIIVEHRRQKQNHLLKQHEREQEERGALLAPLVRIERSECKTKLRSGEVTNGVHSEYEMPRDSCWELSRQLLRLGGQLGEGAFGRVLYGEMVKSAGDSESPRRVAVKMLKEGHTDSDLVDLVSELEVMKLIGHHLNIVSLVGACTQGGPLLVVVEYAPNGNLRSYLRERRPLLNYQRAFNLETLSIRDLASFAYQVARGMQYLASMKCVHRDLAARNVLVGENLTVKIADFGMARDVRDTDYYRKVTDGRLPVKWMAPEALFERVYTSQSDVWSFGILLWEIMSMGGAPYPSVPSVDSLFSLLRSGHRMDPPPGCPSSLYDLMMACWQYHPHNRPSFSSLVESIGTLMTQLSPMEYLDLALPSTDEAADNRASRTVTSSSDLTSQLHTSASACILPPTAPTEPSTTESRLLSKSVGDLS